MRKSKTKRDENFFVRTEVGKQDRLLSIRVLIVSMIMLLFLPGVVKVDAAEPTMLHAVWKTYGGGCSYPSATVNVSSR